MKESEKNLRGFNFKNAGNVITLTAVRAAGIGNVEIDVTSTIMKMQRESSFV